MAFGTTGTALQFPTLMPCVNGYYTKPMTHLQPAIKAATVP
jgi:hypothetical protein